MIAAEADILRIQLFSVCRVAVFVLSCCLNLYRFAIKKAIAFRYAFIFPLCSADGALRVIAFLMSCVSYCSFCFLVMCLPMFLLSRIVQNQEKHALEVSSRTQNR